MNRIEIRVIPLYCYCGLPSHAMLKTRRFFNWPEVDSFVNTEIQKHYRDCVIGFASHKGIVVATDHKLISGIHYQNVKEKI